MRELGRRYGTRTSSFLNSHLCRGTGPCFLLHRNPIDRAVDFCILGFHMIGALLRMFRRIRCKEYRRAAGTHYGPTRRHLAGYSPRHRRDGRAGTLISAFYAGGGQTQALFSDDYGPDGAAGAWATPPHPPGPQDHLWDYGPDGAADAAAAAVGIAGPGAADAAVDSAGVAVSFEELLAGRIRRRSIPEYTAASGRLDHATFRERADASVPCSGF
jgi:hypothetical protein